MLGENLLEMSDNLLSKALPTEPPVTGSTATPSEDSLREDISSLDDEIAQDEEKSIQGGEVDSQEGSQSEHGTRADGAQQTECV